MKVTSEIKKHIEEIKIKDLIVLLEVGYFLHNNVSFKEFYSFLHEQFLYKKNEMTLEENDQTRNILAAHGLIKDSPFLPFNQI